MRLAHCSDLHLGHRRFDRVTRLGINVREADVALSFSRLVEALVVCEPDVVVIAGDVFDQVKPGNHAIVHSLHQFSQLRRKLPNTLVLAVAGNHDAPKRSEVGCFLPALAYAGVRVVDRKVERLAFPDRDLSVLCVPDAPGVEKPAFDPDPSMRYNVALIHGEVAGVTQTGARPRLTDIDPTAFDVPEWDYIALGHYHVVEQVGERAWYSGAIDRTSSNIWAELHTPNGFIIHDLVDGAHEFIELPPSRTIVDLPVIAGEGMTAEQLDATIAASLDTVPGGYADAVVRLVVTGVSRETGRALDARAIARYKARCLNFALDLRKPEREARPIVVRGARQSLEDIVRSRLNDELRTPLPPDVSRAALMAAAARYIEDAYGPEAASDTSAVTTEPVVAPTERRIA